MRILSILILSLPFLLASCGGDTKETPELEKKRKMKDYYFPTLKDGKTRYYIFEESAFEGHEKFSGGNTSKRVERIGKNRLVIVEYRLYSDTIVAVDSSIAESREDGLYYIKSYYGTKYGWKAYDDPGEKLVIRWSWPDGGEGAFGRSISGEDALKYGVDSMNFRGTINFERYGTMDSDFNGKREYVILKGTGTSIRDGEEFTYDITYWDLEGYGLYYYEAYDGRYRFESILVDEIDEKEYKKLFH